MPAELEALLASLLRSRHAERMLPFVQALLLAQLMAGAGHAGPPHGPMRAPRDVRAKRHLAPRRGSLAGRRPRG